MTLLGEIVLTGGPSAGKTSALGHLAQTLPDDGIMPLIVPEAATLLITGGIALAAYGTRDRRRYVELQTQLHRFQLSLRARWRALAAQFPDREVLLLFDRAEMDNAAYLTPEEFAGVMRALDGDLTTWRDSYTGVIHLVTAADGAEEHYTLDNNAARSEMPEEARALDRAVQAAWLGHDHHLIIGNDHDFEAKLAATRRAVLHLLGRPAPREYERRFLVRTPPAWTGDDAWRCIAADGSPAIRSEITQWYLSASETDEHRVREREGDNGTTWTETRKRDLGKDARDERERVVSADDARIALATGVAAGTRPVRKTRTTAMFAHQRIEVDVYHDHLAGLCIAEIESEESGAAVSLPPWLDVACEVTDDRRYRNRSLAAVDDVAVLLP